MESDWPDGERRPRGGCSIIQGNSTGRNVEGNRDWCRGWCLRAVPGAGVEHNAAGGFEQYRPVVLGEGACVSDGVGPCG